MNGYSKPMLRRLTKKATQKVASFKTQ